MQHAVAHFETDLCDSYPLNRQSPVPVAETYLFATTEIDKHIPRAHVAVRSAGRARNGIERSAPCGRPARFRRHQLELRPARSRRQFLKFIGSRGRSTGLQVVPLAICQALWCAYLVLTALCTYVGSHGWMFSV
jgi:hypothetical protein